MVIFLLYKNIVDRTCHDQEVKAKWFYVLLNNEAVMYIPLSML